MMTQEERSRLIEEIVDNQVKKLEGYLDHVKKHGYRNKYQV